MHQKNIKILLEKYKGRWIAVKNGRVVASAKCHDRLYSILLEKNINDTYVIYSPTKKEMEYNLLFPWRVE